MRTWAHAETVVAGWSREARIDSLTVGDFIGVNGRYGEVVKIDGPYGPLGTPPTSDYYTLRVLYDGECHPDTVGPRRGQGIVVSWS